VQCPERGVDPQVSIAVDNGVVGAERRDGGAEDSPDGHDYSQ
jgi:hypothetical protein